MQDKRNRNSLMSLWSGWLRDVSLNPQTRIYKIWKKNGANGRLKPPTIKKEDFKMTVHNLPDTYEQYIVAREVDGWLWFWGSYSFRDLANACALEIGGEVVDADDLDFED
jgi:hypothetical protein